MPKSSSPEKPLAALKSFARSLGWSPLKMSQHVLPAEEMTAPVKKAGRQPAETLVTWYESGEAAGKRSDLFLLISECPMGQSHTYTAAVYATRYRICTGWHSFRLTAKLASDPVEIKRLDGWLHRRWFETLANRQEFRERHPECANYSWERIQTEGLPYHVVDAERCITKRRKLKGKSARKRR